MQCRENKVAGKRCLDSHLRGLLIADFTYHNHIRILPQDRTQAISKGNIRLRINLRLPDQRKLILNRVFNSDDILLIGTYINPRRVKRGGFTATCGPGHKDDAVRTVDQLTEEIKVLL